jgi:hypothetical protein
MHQILKTYLWCLHRMDLGLQTEETRLENFAGQNRWIYNCSWGTRRAGGCSLYDSYPLNLVSKYSHQHIIHISGFWVMLDKVEECFLVFGIVKYTFLTLKICDCLVTWHLVDISGEERKGGTCSRRMDDCGPSQGQENGHRCWNWSSCWLCISCCNARENDKQETQGSRSKLLPIPETRSKH